MLDSLQGDNLVCHYPLHFVSITSYFFSTTQSTSIGSEQEQHLKSGKKAPFV